MFTVPTGSFGAISVASNNLLTSLTAHWKLDEDSGNRIDATGRGSTLISNGDVISAAGKINNSARFSSANSQFLSKSNSSDVNLSSTDSTIALWCYLTTNSNGVFAGVYNAASDTGGSYAINYFSRISFGVTSSGAGAQYVEANANTFIPPINEFFFVVCRHYLGNKLALTINGNNHFETPHTAGIFNSTERFIVGARCAASGGTEAHINGRADSLSIWKRALTDQEILTLYNNGSGLDYPFS